MTINDFRKLALSFPKATESAHMDHPDFRVNNKIFATLLPKKGLGMVKLTPAEQAMFIESDSETFVAVPGGWGRGGATNVRLKNAKKKAVREAMAAAWRNTAPKDLVKEYEADES